MSKTPSRPIILKKEKDDSQREHKGSQRSQPVQPKILTKSSNKENVSVIQKKVAETIEAAPPAVMKTCQRLMHPHFQIDSKVLDYLDTENTDFLVVGVVGKKCVGKTFLANIIASSEFLNISSDTASVSFSKEHEVFPTTGVVYEGNTLDMFITKDRIIFIDTSPLAATALKRDMMSIDSDDLKTLLILTQVCHLIIVVHNGFPDISVARLILSADLAVPTNMKHRPILTYVANKFQPGTAVIQTDHKINKDLNLLIPDLFSPGLFLHHDVSQVIQRFQERVFMMKRFSMDSDEEVVFTEKKWGQRLATVMDQMKNDYFLRKYETLRDKFHQPIENC